MHFYSLKLVLSLIRRLKSLVSLNNYYLKVSSLKFIYKLVLTNLLSLITITFLSYLKNK